MAVDTEKDLQVLRNRFRELADRSFRQNVYIFTGFLGLVEQDVFWQMEKELRYAGCRLQGAAGAVRGSEDGQDAGDGTDRKVLRFGDPAQLGYEEEFPIVCIHMKPLLEKFSDTFSHRDFLGALMNLGIERSTVGDIRVGEKEGYLYCLDTIAEYICEHLEQVKHTHIRCSVIADPGEMPQEKPREEEVLVSSQRADAVAAKVYNMSRAESIDMFRDKKVYIDGRLCENNSRVLKDGETVNVRGYGKFIYSGVKYETKKGKLSLKVLVFR